SLSTVCHGQICRDWQVKRVLLSKILVERFPKSHDLDQGSTYLVDGLDLRVRGSLVGGLYAVQETGKITVDASQPGCGPGAVLDCLICFLMSAMLSAAFGDFCFFRSSI